MLDQPRYHSSPRFRIGRHACTAMFTCISAVSSSSPAVDISFSASSRLGEIAQPRRLVGGQAPRRTAGGQRGLPEVVRNGDSVRSCEAAEQRLQHGAIVPERVPAPYNFRSTLFPSMAILRSTADPSVPADARGPAAFDLARTRELVEPLYQDRTLRTGEPFLAHAEASRPSSSRCAPIRTCSRRRICSASTTCCASPTSGCARASVPTVAQLVADLRQLMRLSELTRTHGDGGGKSHGLEDQAEALRRMLLAMANDLRVVLLRLASRLQTLRYYAANKQPGSEPFARETLLLYAPLANRLGIWQMKWELEDLAFRFLEPETYKQVARLLEEKRVEREAFIVNALERVRSMLKDARHPRRGVGPAQAHLQHRQQDADERAGVRAALRRARPARDRRRGVAVLPGAVARAPGVEPDRDRVRRLHRATQAQRVPVAAHRGGRRRRDARSRSRSARARCTSSPNSVWRRTGATRKAARRARPTSSAWRGCGSCSRGATKSRRRRRRPAAQRDERIYVLTPQARVVELPAGGTPIDFAYHIHSELGHRCRGAKVNGAMVPLNTPLRERPDRRDHRCQDRRAEPRLAERRARVPEERAFAGQGAPVVQRASNSSSRSRPDANWSRRNCNGSAGPR